MKTQSFGRRVEPLYGAVSRDLWTHPPSHLLACSLPTAQKDYREKRENGDERDRPKRVFPNAGLDALEIIFPDWQGSSKWPDNAGRYWWKLTCKSGVVNDFYWMEDNARGFPDGSENYWFSVHHAPSGIKMEGFSGRPDNGRGYPNESWTYWSCIRYDECGPIKAWMEEKDRNYVARLNLEKQSEQSKAVAQRALEEKRQQALEAQRLRAAEEKRLEERNEKQPAQIKQPEQAILDVEKAQSLVAAEKKAVVKIKTQSFGRLASVWMVPWGRGQPLFIDGRLRKYMPSLCRFSASGQKNYRDKRENGDERDSPQRAFPSAGFDALEINSGGSQGSSKWPDNAGRYWWKLTCKNGVVNDFYWMEDNARGFPDGSGNYWFSVHHAPSGTKMEGFSARPDREKGYPDKSGTYWSCVQYDECGPIKEWMEEKDRNYVARLNLEKQSEQSKAVAQRALEEKRQQALEAQRLRAAEEKRLEDRKAQQDREKPAAQLQLKQLQKATLDIEKAQLLFAAEKKALEQERRQWAQQKRQYEEAQGKKSSNPRDDSFQIRYEDLQLKQKLGEGAFGEVHYGKWHFEDVAVKTLRLQQLSENALREFKEEAAIMARLRSDYIVLLKGVSLKPYALVMGYMPNGSLFNILHSQAPLPMPLRHQMALDIAKGLAFLHQHPPHGILHRDLKSQNVLLTEHNRAKLADFGLSKVRVESSRSQCYAKSPSTSVGTIPWMAPECFGIRPKYSEKSDMYAYGMVLWEIASRKMPYEDVANADEIRVAVRDGEREEIPEEIANPRAALPAPFKQVIHCCFFKAPADRPTARQAIERLGDDIPAPVASSYFSASSSSLSSSSSGSGLPSGFVSDFSNFKY